MKNLKFGIGNAKMNHMAESMNLKKSQVVTFDLPAGYTCPMASMCKAFASKKTGKIIDGKSMIFRCYAASIESRFKNSRLAHWHNFDLLKNLDEKSMVELINSSIKKNVKIVRIHSSGDFFSQDYFNAWVKVASMNQDITFFGYTKIVDYVKAIKPSNFKLVYSMGGLMDNQVDNSIPTCKVVEYSEDSLCKSKDFSHEDFYFIMAEKSFTLNLHGTQPKNRAKIQA